MASKSYLPSREEELLAWAQNFSTLITATPTAYGLTAADATALATLVSAYTTALAAATNPSTSTPATVATKNTARVTMVASIRSLVKRIQATVSVTPTQKVSLGINVKDPHPTPIPAPSTRPVMSVVAVVGRTVSVRVTDETTPTKRAKPAGAAGLQLHHHRHRRAADGSGSMVLRGAFWIEHVRRGLPRIGRTRHESVGVLPLVQPAARSGTGVRCRRHQPRRRLRRSGLAARS